MEDLESKILLNKESTNRSVKLNPGISLGLVIISAILTVTYFSSGIVHQSYTAIAELNAQAPEPSSTVSYNGKMYASLGGGNVHGWQYKCQSGQYLIPPNGWEIAPDDADSRGVTAAYPWDTHVNVFSNGCGYGSASYTRGALWNCGMLGQSGNAYTVNSCSLMILIRKVDNPQVSEPSSTVSYNGKIYASLGGGNVNGWQYKCQSDRFLIPPIGWEVAPDDADSRGVTAAYPWDTHVNVMSNGCGYGSASYTRGALWSCGMLGQSGNAYKVNSCSLMVLIMKSKPPVKYAPHPTLMIQYKGYYYATLSGADPHGKSYTCQQEYLALPNGWEVAPDEVDSRAANTMYPWTTHVNVFSNGYGYGTGLWNIGLWNYNMLGKVDKGGVIEYKPNACHLQILIRKQAPTSNPTPFPIAHPTHHPIPNPTQKPTKNPTHEPTHKPTHKPSDHPVAHPTHQPIAEPTLHPNAEPTHKPSDHPVAHPTHHPIAEPTLHPNAEPTMAPNPIVEEKLEKKIEEEEEKDNKKLEDEIKDDEKKLGHVVADNQESKSDLNGLKDELVEIKEQIGQADLDKENAKQALISSEEIQKDGVDVDLFNHHAKENLKKSEEVIENLVEKMKDIVHEIKKEEKIAEESDMEIKDLENEIQRDQESLKVNEKIIDEIDKIKDARDGLICHFTFESGITKVVVPDGCVFFGETDIHVAQQRTMITPALYICSDKHSPNLITSDIFEKYGLVTDKKSKISMIKPGDSVKVEFYPHDDLKGSKGTFTRLTYKSLTTYYYKDNRVSANDNVMSALVTSSTDAFPSSCKELKYSDKMSLISESGFRSKNK